jgi:TPP-dependent pyruvate/acetoin dehydrogenase alpha subunit
MRVEIEEEIRRAIEFARTSPFPEAAATVFPVVAGSVGFDCTAT